MYTKFNDVKQSNLLPPFTLPHSLSQSKSNIPFLTPINYLILSSNSTPTSPYHLFFPYHCFVPHIAEVDRCHTPHHTLHLTSPHTSPHPTPHPTPPHPTPHHNIQHNTPHPPTPHLTPPHPTPPLSSYPLTHLYFIIACCII